MSSGLYIVGYILLIIGLAIGAHAARALEVDGNHSRDDGDSTQGSAVLAVTQLVHRQWIRPMANRRRCACPRFV